MACGAGVLCLVFSARAPNPPFPPIAPGAPCQRGGMRFDCTRPGWSDFSKSSVWIAQTRLALAFLAVPPSRRRVHVRRASGGVGVCDMHKTITDYCGVGYRTCDIAQCGGPRPPGSTTRHRKHLYGMSDIHRESDSSLAVCSPPRCHAATRINRF